MKKLILTGFITLASLSSLASGPASNGVVGSVGIGKIQECQAQALQGLQTKVASMNDTHIVGFVASKQLEPHTDEDFFFQEEVWNSLNVPIAFYLYKLNTAGITYNKVVQVTLPDCKVTAIYNHGEAE